MPAETASTLPSPAQPRFGAPSLRVKAFDLHTRFFLLMIKTAIRAWKSDLPTVDKVRPPRLVGVLPMKDLPFGDAKAPLRLPTLDEDWPAPDWKRRAFLAFLRSPWVFPLKDSEEAWVCAEEARDTFQEVLPLGSFMARPYHYWSEMGSDAAMSRIAFAGLGALRLLPYTPVEPHEPGHDPALASAAWVNDFAFLGAYEVRPGFERYGARAYFDAEQRPVAVYTSAANRVFRPGDPEWAHAKWAWRCSLMVGTTVTDHLVGVHWLIGNYVTTASRIALSPTHYLRLLLKPFTWRTVTINAGASDSLCPELGFVHRASALTYPALRRAFGDSVGLLHFQTVPEMIAKKGLLDRVKSEPDRYPWAADALAYYEVILAFVREYVALYATPEQVAADPEVQSFWDHLGTAPASVKFPDRTPEGLVQVLAQFIWSVTGLHEAVGTVHEYVLDPTFMGTKIRPGREMADVQASMQYLLIMALTGLDMPGLMEIGDAGGVYGADWRGRKAFADLNANLQALSVRIDEANQRRRADPDRPWPCETFNPKNLETGVSI